ncbi:hypothetical protein MMC29_004580 [Sticta canariensis]|nr:hypothetical protein [Sticta canariensis]
MFDIDSFAHKSRQLTIQNVTESTALPPFLMRLCNALLLATISKTIADPLALDYILPDGLLPASDSSFEDNPNPSTSPNWKALPPVESNFVAVVGTDSSEWSDSDVQSPDIFSLDNQDGFNTGLVANSIAAASTDISNSECSSGTAQISNTLRSREKRQICPPIKGSDPATEIQEQQKSKEDIEDEAWTAAYEEEHGKEVDKKAEFVCQRIPDHRILPLCCRGPQIAVGWAPLVTIVVENCVAFIEGRPRCMDLRRRFCCWLLGFSGTHLTKGIDCRTMYENLDQLIETG